MSFDSVLSNIADTAESVSIPLEQGNVFRHLSLWCNHCVSSVSIPLEQGNVFRQTLQLHAEIYKDVSIPLEQGNVFRLQ